MVGFAAAGYGEVWVNGKKANDAAVLEPGWSQWNKRLLVPLYDVTDLVHLGTNAVGVALGASWYGHLNGTPALKAALLAQNPDGAIVSVPTNMSWTAGKCPITYNDIYNGETYDARLERKNWASPCGGRGWRAANASSTPPAHTEFASLWLQEMPPISKLELLPVSEMVTIRANGSALLDFGVNIAGWVQLNLDDCRPGTAVTIRHAEILTDDRAALNTSNLRTAKATDTYICSGGPVTHEPRFVYHGFRFVEIQVDGAAVWSWAKQKARVVHTAVQQRGEVVMENVVLTKVQAAFRQTVLDNLHSIPTDCSQRDERQGWMGDAALAAELAAYNFDMRAFYVNWLQVMTDAQSTGNEFGDCNMPNGTNASIECKGAMTDTSPHIPGQYGLRPADPSWGVALPVTAELLQRHYGQPDVEALYAPAVHAWADFLLSVRDTYGVVRYHYYGDWMQPGRVASTEVVSEMTSGFSSIIAVDYAAKVGNKEERQHYVEESAAMRRSYLNAFWDEQSKWFGDGTQAPQVFALTLQGLSSEQESGAWSRLLERLSTEGGLRTGIFATKFLFTVLSKHGRTDLGLQLASSTAYPSWGYEIENGATTMWEHWAGGKATGPGGNSYNHPAFTAAGAWFYTDLAGIRVEVAGALGLGPTLNEYNDLLPSACGSLMIEEGLAEIKWAMRPHEVNIAGRCPKAQCLLRVPLNGMDFAAASVLLKQQGLRAVPCGPAACGNVTTGVFSFTLSSNVMMHI